MNSGLPRHFTVTAWPTWIGCTFTSMDESAKVSAAGLRLLMKGQATVMPPTAPNAPVATMRKSRRLGSPWPVAGMLGEAILSLFHPPEELRAFRPQKRLMFQGSVGRRPGPFGRVTPCRTALPRRGREYKTLMRLALYQPDIPQNF